MSDLSTPLAWDAPDPGAEVERLLSNPDTFSDTFRFERFHV